MIIFIPILLLLISSLVSSLCSNSNNIEVVLQFDGSFRPPKDDPGYPRLPRRMAVCSFSIVCITQAQQKEERHGGPTDDIHRIIYYPVAVGSRFLPIQLEMTSAHAEYEGLILGLNHLCCNPDPSSSSSIFLNHLNQQDNNVTLKIQGDCKTVIDQINGKSKPRKLEKLYRQVMDCIGRIMSNKEYQFSELIIDHIPRKLNHVSDNLCGNHMLMVAFREYESIFNDLESLKLQQNQNQQQQQQQQTLSEVFNRCVSESSFINYSTRPALFMKIASLAEEMKEYDTLRKVGEQLVLESRFVALSQLNDQKNNKKTRDDELLMKNVGVKYQIYAMKCLGLDKKATVLERKHRVFLNTMNNHQGTVDDTDVPMIIDAMSNVKQYVVSPLWDESIRPEWNFLLGRWWDKARDSDELLTISEGCPSLIENDK